MHKNEARRETLSNPFRRKRRANGEARYLNKREEQMPRGTFDRGGNPENIHWRGRHD